MALNEQDRAWIREQIDNAFKRRSLGQRIRDWLPVTAIVAIAIFFITQWTSYIEFRTRTNDRLDTIDKTLAGIQGDLSKQSLINHAALPLPDFKATLPDLNSAIARAKQQNAKVSSAVIGDLQQKLSASVDAPDFWPTAAQFISYRSQNTLPDFQSLMQPNLPNCTDHEPTPMELVVSDEEAKNGKQNDTALVSDLLKETDKNKTHMVSAVYQDCRFTLDSPEETARIPNLGTQRSYVLTFRHCQIVYRGGEIKLLTPNPRPTAITGKSNVRSDVYVFIGQTVHFENCLFAFVISSQPPKEGQSLTEQLLAQGGSYLTVQAKQSATHS